jgi:hypothetical protein
MDPAIFKYWHSAEHICLLLLQGMVEFFNNAAFLV